MIDERNRKLFVLRLDIKVPDMIKIGAERLKGRGKLAVRYINKTRTGLMNTRQETEITVFSVEPRIPDVFK